MPYGAFAMAIAGAAHGLLMLPSIRTEQFQFNSLAIKAVVPKLCCGVFRHHGKVMGASRDVPSGLFQLSWSALP